MIKNIHGKINNLDKNKTISISILNVIDLI